MVGNTLPPLWGWVDWAAKAWHGVQQPSLAPHGFGSVGFRAFWIGVGVSPFPLWGAKVPGEQGNGGDGAGEEAKVEWSGTCSLLFGVG